MFTLYIPTTIHHIILMIAIFFWISIHLIREMKLWNDYERWTLRTKMK